MDEFIKLLNNNLQYISHEIINNTVYVEVASTKDAIKCSYCGVEWKRIHSRYKKAFKICPYKVIKL